LADSIFVAYADPCSKTEELCREAVRQGKSVFTIRDDLNAHLLGLGARSIQSDIATFA
jgi:hypothetical protein